MIAGVRAVVGMHLRCYRSARELQAYLDGEVDDRTAAAVAGHLEQCRRCGLEARTYAAIKAALAAREDGGKGGAGRTVGVDAVVLARLDRFARALSASDGR